MVYSIFSNYCHVVVKNDIINVAITIQAFEAIRFYITLRLFKSCYNVMTYLLQILSSFQFALYYVSLVTRTTKHIMAVKLCEKRQES